MYISLFISGKGKEVSLAHVLLLLLLAGRAGSRSSSRDCRKLWKQHLGSLCLQKTIEGFQILSTALWHAQDARRLSMLAMQITEECRMSPEGWCVAGNCFSVQKQHETAIECFERAVTIETHFPYGYTLLGHELLDSDQYDKAAAAFRQDLCFLNIFIKF